MGAVHLVGVLSPRKNILIEHTTVIKKNCSWSPIYSTQLIYTEVCTSDSNKYVISASIVK